MENKLGDKCLADTMKVYDCTSDLSNPEIRDKTRVSLFAEVDGLHFDSTDYPSYQAWLQAIVERVYACAMGQVK